MNNTKKVLAYACVIFMVPFMCGIIGEVFKGGSGFVIGGFFGFMIDFIVGCIFLIVKAIMYLEDN